MKISDLKGKTVFITGASKGIGKAVAEEFLRNECKVISLSRSNPNMDSPLHAYMEGDISDFGKVSEWLENFEKTNGKVDVLINNAAVCNPVPLTDVDENHWDDIMRVNAKALFFVSQAFAKHMKKNGHGVIINAASFAVHLASMGYGIYAGSKSLVSSLTKSMAAEWAPFGIRVLSYSPGVVKTDMTAPAIAKNKENMLDDIALKRFGEAREVAPAIAFLASDKASYITGINLDIHGGKFSIQNPDAAWRQ